MGEKSADARFGPSKRLRNAKDYNRVFQHADARASHHHLLLLGRHNGLRNHRLGLIIAKKHVRLSARRNRIKRLAREFFRCQPDSDRCMDVVLLARRDLDKLDNIELSSILQHQWQRLLRVSAQAHTHQDS
ncbi:MAG: ribonuclease P protein component [Halioglobus sp.]|nr:ribonuclease P protein component [Halioglobus sp.]